MLTNGERYASLLGLACLVAGSTSRWGWEMGLVVLGGVTMVQHLACVILSHISLLSQKPPASKGDGF